MRARAAVPTNLTPAAPTRLSRQRIGKEILEKTLEAAGGSALKALGKKKRKRVAEITDKDEALVAEMADPDISIGRVLESLVKEGELPGPTEQRRSEKERPPSPTAKDPTPLKKVAFQTSPSSPAAPWTEAEMASMAGLIYPAANDYATIPVKGSILSDPSASHRSLNAFVQPVYDGLASLPAEKLLRNFELHLSRVSVAFRYLLL